MMEHYDTTRHCSQKYLHEKMKQNIQVCKECNNQKDHSNINKAEAWSFELVEDCMGYGIQEDPLTHPKNLETDFFDSFYHFIFENLAVLIWEITSSSSWDGDLPARFPRT